MILIVAPHFWDAVYSMGGSLNRSRRKKDVVVVVVFSQCASRDMLASEHNRACLHLGMDTVELGFQEASERVGWKNLYHIGGELIGTEPAETLAKTLAQVLDYYPSPKEVFAPLSIGRHIDHVLAHMCTRWVVAKNDRLIFYEDQPFASNALDPQRARIRVADLNLGCLSTLSDFDWGDKERLLRFYAGHARALGNESISKMERYARLLSNDGKRHEGEFHERYWSTPRRYENQH